MLRLLFTLFGAEIRHTVRRASMTALLLVIGGGLVAISLLFFLAAAFILLADRYDAVTASLVVAGFTLVSGLIFLLVAVMRTRRRPRAPAYGAFSVPPVPPAAAPGAMPGAMPGTPPGGAPPGNVSAALAIAAGAALVGLILGRRV